MLRYQRMLCLLGLLSAGCANGPPAALDPSTSESLSDGGARDPADVTNAAFIDNLLPDDVRANLPPRDEGPSDIADAAPVPEKSYLGNITNTDLAALGAGYGFNVYENLPLFPCVTGLKNSTGAGSGNLSIGSEVSQSQLDSALGIDAQAKADFGLIGANAQASFRRQASESTRSANLIYRFTGVTRTETLDEAHLTWNVPLNSSTWQTRCGDAYVQKLSYGGELYIAIRVDFATEAEKNAFQANVGIKALFGALEGTANGSYAWERFDSRTAVHVEAFQRGGDTGSLNQIAGGTIQGARAFADCSFGSFAACNTFLANALHYGGTSFAYSIAKNPAILSYTTREWSLLQGPVAKSVPSSITLTRSWLYWYYQQMAAIAARIEFLERVGYYGQPQSFVANVNLYKLAVAANISQLDAGVKKCFDDLSPVPTTSEINACSSSLPSASTGWYDLANAARDLDVPLPTYAAYGRSDVVSIGSLSLGHYGTMRSFVACPPGQFAIGYQQRVEGYLGPSADDTGLNAIKLLCSPPNRSTTSYIESYPGLWGTYQSEARCLRGAVSGLKLWLQAPAGDADDLGATNVSAHCLSGEEIQSANYADITRYGSEPYDAYCPDGTAVCGFRIGFESDQGSGWSVGDDDTAMNGLEQICCAY